MLKLFNAISQRIASDRTFKPVLELEKHGKKIEATELCQSLVE
jgi:hypothetical protein